jgi:hypothetical protein
VAAEEAGCWAAAAAAAGGGGGGSERASVGGGAARRGEAVGSSEAARHLDRLRRRLRGPTASQRQQSHKAKECEKCMRQARQVGLRLLSQPTAAARAAAAAAARGQISLSSQPNHLVSSSPA